MESEIVQKIPEIYGIYDFDRMPLKIPPGNLYIFRCLRTSMHVQPKLDQVLYQPRVSLTPQASADIPVVVRWGSTHFHGAPPGQHYLTSRQSVGLPGSGHSELQGGGFVSPRPLFAAMMTTAFPSMLSLIGLSSGRLGIPWQ